MSVPSGLKRRFACTGCGECCTGRGSYVIEVSRAEQRRIQRFLGITWAWLRRRYMFRFADETETVRMHPNGDCVFLVAASMQSGHSSAVPIRFGRS